jgi:hypothetical protein
MNRFSRISINVFGPPIVASFFYSLITAVSGELSLLDMPSMFLAVLVYAAFFAALPSIVHATFMEVTYTYLPAEKLTATIISAASGFISGSFVAFLLSGGAAGSWSESASHPIERPFPTLGLTTGLTVGLFIKILCGRNTPREKTLA